ncbi:MAG: hypothetical protein ACRC33_03015 [Gemmataceae bacterium]
MNGTASVVARLQMLGLQCDDVPADRVSSAVAALACFPMYMVANVHGWTADRQFKLPLLDIQGSEAFREAVAIGGQEARLEISSEHGKVVGSMLTSAKPPDRVIYEYALATLKEYLAVAHPAVADGLRAAVARMVVTVAKASGEYLFGLGEKVCPEERECIRRIASELQLAQSPKAAAELAKL